MTAKVARKRARPERDHLDVSGSIHRTINVSGNIDRKPKNKARKKQFNSEKLRGVAKRHRDQCARFTKLVNALTDATMGDMKIDGTLMMEHGLDYIDGWLSNAERALREAQAKQRPI